MKKTEIALIILIALISVGLSWWLGNLLLKDPDENVATVKYMDQIGSTLDEPNTANFNAYAPNPTVEVYIGKCPYGEKWDESQKSCVSNLEEVEEDENE